MRPYVWVGLVLLSAGTLTYALSDVPDARAEGRTSTTSVREVPEARSADARHIRLGDPTAVGLAAGTRVNAAMFVGVNPTPEQAEEIARLAATFAAERPAIIADGDVLAPWDAAQSLRIERFVERQRLAYRAVLTSAQHPTFDANVARITEEWRARRARIDRSGVGDREGGR